MGIFTRNNYFNAKNACMNLFKWHCHSFHIVHSTMKNVISLICGLEFAGLLAITLLLIIFQRNITKRDLGAGSTLTVCFLRKQKHQSLLELIIIVVLIYMSRHLIPIQMKTLLLLISGVALHENFQPALVMNSHNFQ